MDFLKEGLLEFKRKGRTTLSSVRPEAMGIANNASECKA